MVKADSGSQGILEGVLGYDTLWLDSTQRIAVDASLAVPDESGFSFTFMLDRMGCGKNLSRGIRVRYRYLSLTLTRVVIGIRAKATGTPCLSSGPRLRYALRKNASALQGVWPGN